MSAILSPVDPCFMWKKTITMCAAINNPASCEVRAVIRFLLARNNNAAEIHRQLCEVYGPNVMSYSKVRQWCRLFEEGRSGRPSVITDDLVEKVNTALRGNRRFTISELSLEFPQVSRSMIYDIVSEKLGYKKLCARLVPKMLTDEHKQKHLVLTILSLEMRRGFATQTSSQSVSQCNGATHRPRKQRSSSKHLQSEKPWPPFSGTERGSCLLIF